jgi:hypothetical protein
MNEPKRNQLFVSPAFLVTAIVGLFIGLIVVVVIPNFIKTHSTSAQNPCINNLRQIDAAKNEWALEKGKTNGTVATENDIKPYIKLDSNGNIPRCPSGGKYTIGKVGENPTCSLGTTVNPPHVLP